MGWISEAPLSPLFWIVNGVALILVINHHGLKASLGKGHRCISRFPNSRRVVKL
jgi:hypothetical protein